MTHEWWRAIHTAIDDIDRLVGEVTPLALRPAEDGGARAQAALRGLHDDARSEISQLRTQLELVPARDYVVLMLVLFVDERIMHELPETLRLSWPLLQTEWIGSSNGGDEFYRITDRLLQDPATPSSVFETIYFCLSSGFVGRYAHNLEGVEDYKQLVRERIELPAVSQPPPEQGGTRPSLDPGRSPVWRYLGAAALFVVCNLFFVGISNCSP